MEIEYFQESHGTDLKNAIKEYIQKRNITRNQIVNINVWTNSNTHYAILIYENWQVKY